MTRHLTAALLIAAIIPAGASAADASSQAAKALKEAAGARKTAEKALDKVKAFAGKKGEPGPKGPKGPKGEQGAGGAKGETGPQGLPGPSGSPGTQGGQGGQGATGAQGPTGPQGPLGPTGQRGPTGGNGSAGPTGARGPTGPTGPGGTPDGYFTNRVSPTTLTTSYAEIVGIDLPAGNYLAFASTSLVDFSATKDGIGRCGIRLQTQEPTFEHSAVIGKDPATPDGEAVTTLALQDAFSLPIPARIGLVCKTLVDLGTDAAAEMPELSVIQMATVHR